MNIRAEIHADPIAEAKDLARIAQRCAVDLGIVLPCRSKYGPERYIQLITDAETVLELNNVYCLLCHLACFCPRTRVSLLILAQDAFEPARTALRQSPTA